MNAKMVFYLIQIVMTFLVTSCTNSQATVKFQPGDKNVESGQTLQWSFDSDPVGALPAGSQAFTGKWEVRADTNAPSPHNVLCQTGMVPFPALSLSDKIFADAVVSTSFKSVSGSIDQAAGIIFRIQDKDNYYILRANALEDNVIIFKYVGGNRAELQEGSAKVPTGKWQELRVEIKGNVIRGFLNGKLVVLARDDTFKAGKVGL